MRKVFVVLVILILIVLGVFGWQTIRDQAIVTPIGKKVQEITEKPFAKYTFQRLRDADIPASPIAIGRKLKDDPDFASYEFYYTVDKSLLGTKEDQRVSGLINIPKTTGTYPVLVMFRGFVPRETFTTGEGTRRTAEEFARNGFITLAPDFLSFGESDNPKVSSMEDRFQTYPTALTMLNSVQYLPAALDQLESRPQPTISEPSDQTFSPDESEASISGVLADTSKIGIWGHSNGGHITLSVLAISGKSYPTVLWNPVTKPFPYSILYFTDEYEDEGKALRKVVADFEQDYDVFDYSPSRYYKWIQAPIKLDQGGLDEEVPVHWSDQFVDSMKKIGKDIEYTIYPGENHNFNNGAWPEIMESDIQFYTDHFTK